MDNQPQTLWQKIQAEIKSLEAEAGIQLSAFEAKLKAHFETHAAAAVPDTVSGTTQTVAAVLDTTPAAPPAP